MSPVALKLLLASMLALLLITAADVWKAQNWCYGQQLAAKAGLHKNDLAMISSTSRSDLCRSG